jgi:FkbM family methyltransferase
MLRRIGLSVSRATTVHALPDALLVARNAGFEPATVIDIGAAFGDWSRQCREVFPDAAYLMVEPLIEYQEHLKSLPANTRLISAAAASTSGQVHINVHDDLVGSSLYREAEGEGVDGSQRLVDAVRIDDIAVGTAGPYLVKVDAQGGELEVLRGGENTLKQSGLVILEGSLFQFFLGGPLIDEVISFMGDRGFVPYDIFGHLYRPLDGALAQVDVAFVQRKGRLRIDQRYARPDQRRAQNRRMAAVHGNRHA